MKLYRKGMEPMAQDEFEARIVAALERRSSPAVPAEFASRVAAALPAVPVIRRRAHAARTVAVVACVLLLTAMLWLAPHSTASFANLAFDMEMALIAQLAALSWWMARVWDAI